MAEYAVPGLERLTVRMGFRIDAAKQGWIEGGIAGQLRFECRVCLKPFDWPLDVRLQLAIAKSEADEARLIEHAEPYLVVDDRVMLHEIVEEEILLTIPMMPRCPACENARPLVHASAGESSPEPGRKTGGLAALKNLSLKGVTPARGK
ncbi:MAG: YceD family protein [Panacagrimonas sp.]